MLRTFVTMEEVPDAHLREVIQGILKMLDMVVVREEYDHNITYKAEAGPEWHALFKRLEKNIR